MTHGSTERNVHRAHRNLARFHFNGSFKICGGDAMTAYI